MILLFLITVLLVPHWQVVSSNATPTAVAENVVVDVAAEDDNKNANTSQVNDEQKKIDERREMLESILRASQEEVFAVVEAYKAGRTTADQYFDATRRNFLVTGDY